MYRKPLKSRLVAVSLFLVLAMAEAMALVHSLDFDAHTAGEPCKICISVAGLGTGAPAKSPPVHVPCSDVPLAAVHPAAVPVLRAQRPSARGPPLLS